MSQPTEEIRERIISKMTEAGGQLRVRGALNPILWLCAVIGGPCIFALSWGTPPTIIYIILYAVVGAAIFGFLFLLLFDRDRLQSEEYQRPSTHLPCKCLHKQSSSRCLILGREVANETRLYTYLQFDSWHVRGSQKMGY
jgi:hypothetical protein